MHNGSGERSCCSGHDHGTSGSHHEASRNNVSTESGRHHAHPAGREHSNHAHCPCPGNHSASQAPEKSSLFRWLKFGRSHRRTSQWPTWTQRDSELSAPLIHRPHDMDLEAHSFASLTCDNAGMRSRFHVQGMHCAGCAQKLISHLSRQPGIIDARVSLLQERAEVQFDPMQITRTKICHLMEQLNLKATVLIDDTKVHLRLCVSSVAAGRFASELQYLNGVRYVEIEEKNTKHSKSGNCASLSGGAATLAIVYDAQKIGARDILRHAREKLDGSATLACTSSDGRSIRRTNESNSYWLSLVCSSILIMPILFVAYVVPSLPHLQESLEVEVVRGLSKANLIAFSFATPIQFVMAVPIYRAAVISVWFSGQTSMDVLVSLSTLIAYFFSVASLLDAMAGGPAPETFFESSSILIFLVLLGRQLEDRVKVKARSTLASLISRQTSKVTLVQDNEADKELDPQLIHIGDKLKVLPGATIPTDGVVISGKSLVDEKMISGESRLASKSEGSLVFGGTINQHGTLIIETRKTIHETVLSKMANYVENADNSPPSVQRYADLFASYFTYAIVAVSVVCFLVWFHLASSGVVGTGGLSAYAFALRFAIALMVISCPCAFQLASPTVVAVAASVAARHGILSKGGAFFEEAARVDAIVFDKTGTLTVGRMAVCGATLLVEDRIGFWSVVASIERLSEHPLSAAIVGYATSVPGTKLLPVEDFVAEPGYGISARQDGATYFIGSRAYLESRGVEVNQEHIAAIDSLSWRGATVVCVARSSILLGFLELKDQLRPEAAEVVAALAGMGIECWLISGDNLGSTRLTAESLKLQKSRVFAEVKPADKAAKVLELREAGKTVAMVGDGVNDVMCLKAANVGIAMGCGSDVSLEAGSFVLLRDDLWGIVSVMELSRVCMRRISLNFLWAIAYNLVAIPLAFGVLYPSTGIFVPPGWAGASEMLSSLPIILFSLTLRSWLPKGRSMKGQKTFSGESGGRR